MFCSIHGDFGAFQVECSECLCEKLKIQMTRSKDHQIYIAILQSMKKLFCSFGSDFIPREVQCSECFVILTNVNQMFGPINTDFIVCEIECGECLCEKNGNINREEPVIHLVIFQCMNQMLYSFVADLVVFKTEYNKCLYKRLNI